MTLLAGVSTYITYGGLTFGSVDSNGVKWRIKSFQGWGSELSTISIVRNVRQPGGWAGDAFMAERYLTLTLVVSAPTPTLLNQALDSLHTAVSFTPSLFTVAEAGMTRSLMVRRSTVSVEDQKASSTVAYPTFQVLAPLPQKLGTALSGTGTVGGSAVVLTNPGNAAGPVVLTIHGAVTAPTITQVAGSITRVFALTSSVASGSSVVVNMTDHTALLSGVSQSMYVSSRQWFTFEPGSNSFSLAGSGAGNVNVSATPAWL